MKKTATIIKNYCKILCCILAFGMFFSISTQAQNVYNLNADAQTMTFRSDKNVPQEFIKEAKTSRSFKINPVLQNAKSISMGDIVNLQLFDEKNYTAIINNIVTDVNGNFTLTLKLPEYPMAWAIITTNTYNKSLVSISIPELDLSFGSRYSIYTNDYYLIEIDENKIERLQNENDAIEIPKVININENPESQLRSSQAYCGPASNTNVNNPAQIDLLIVYTPAAAGTTYASSLGGINNVIAKMIALGNTCLEKSETGIKLNLAHSAQVGYVETGDMYVSLPRLADSGDGYMDNVHALRKQYNADLVQLITTDSNSGGLGYTLSGIGAEKGSYAYGFSVVNVTQVGDTYPCSVHELGHNMGLGHGATMINPGSGIFDYSYGWTWDGTSYYSIGGQNTKKKASVMSYWSGENYADGIHAVNVPYFSNPNVDYEGQPTGNTTKADAARSLREMKHVIAYYSDRLANIPEVPQNITFTNPTDHGATFSWDAVANATSYEFRIYVGGNWWGQSGIKQNSITINWSNTGFAYYLSPCTTYSYYVAAENDCGDGNSSPILTFTTKCSSSNYNISTSSNPSAGGSTTGGGSFASGASCTVKATTNTGYSFANWTENSSVVYSNASYTFNVLGNRNLVANFKSNDANLKSLTVNQGTLTPTFSATTTSYSVSVANSIASITISAEANHTAASVSGTGTKSLSVGENSFNIVVTAEDVTTKKTYTVVVTREAAVTTYNISTSSNPSAGGSTSGGGSFASGASCTVKATANTGYSFANWTENSSVVSSNASYTFSVSGNRNLVANFKSNDANLKSLSVNQGTLTPTFSATTTNYSVSVANSITSITISAEANNTAATLSGTGTKSLSVGENSFNIVVTAEDGTTKKTYTVVVTREAAVTTYNISTSSNPSAGGSTSGGGTYSYGSTTTITANAATGYEFVNWTKNGAVVSTNTSLSFTVTENASYVANFTLKSFTITVQADPSSGGTVSGGGTYSYGSTTTITATAATGYEFVNWTKNGAVVSTNTSLSFTVTENASYVANFTLKSFTITVQADPSSGGTVSGGGTYSYGSTTTITATAATGYEFVNWTKNGAVVSTNTSLSFNVTENANLIAHFALKNTFNISTYSNPSAGGSTTGGGNYTSGASCTVTATANSGYSFDNWTENSSFVSSNASYTFTVSTNRNLVANFKSNDATLKSLTVNQGTLSSAFSATTTNYSVSVANSITSITINAEANHTAASVSGTGEKSLSVGENTFDIVVTAENGTTKKTYTVVVTREDDDNTTISKVESSGLKIFPNPAKEEVFIISEFPVKKVEIYSLTGVLRLLNNNFNEKISVSALPKGMYIIKIYTTNEVIINKITKK